MLRKFLKSKKSNGIHIPYGIFKDIIDFIQEGVWIYDVAEDKFSSYSKNPKLSYLNKKDVPLKHIASSIHPEDRENIISQSLNFIDSSENKFESIYRVKDAQGKYIWIYSIGVKSRKKGILKIYGSHLDITEKVDMQEKIMQLGFYDLLTNLPNKEKLALEFSNIINSKKNELKFSFFLLEIENFDYINNTLSFEAGEKVLKHFAKLLSERYKEHYVSKINDNQFVILYLFQEEKEIELEVNELFLYLHDTYIENSEINVSINCGVANFTGESFNKLLRNSAIALYKSKSLGKNHYYLFKEDLVQSVYNMQDLYYQMKDGIKNNQFKMFYQPIISLETGLLSGLEALIRWEHPNTGIIPPCDFIYIAEKYGQMKALELWILDDVFHQLNIWANLGDLPLFVSINLSARGLIGESLVPFIKELTQLYNINPEKVQFEITETSLLENLSAIISDIELLKEMGFKVSLDDFGTGYSSLLYLKSLPINKVKLDKSFIKNIDSCEKDEFFIKSIIDLAHNIGLVVIAEGVEKSIQEYILKKYNCDFIQGYLYSKPKSVEDINIWIRENYIKRKNDKK